MLFTIKTKLFDFIYRFPHIDLVLGIVNKRYAVRGWAEKFIG